MKTSKALFYPSIEIHDENWLKSSLLFWDEMHTIVPESMHNPYRNKTTSYLYEKEILKPEIVSQDHQLVKNLSELIIQHLNTDEGLQLFSNIQERKLHRMTSRDPWMRIGRELERGFRIHSDKLSYELQQYLERDILDEWVLTDSTFAEFYMTLLSNLICNEKGYKLLTNNADCSNLSEKVKLGNKKVEMYRGRPDNINQQLAQGMLMNLIIQSISFHPSTNIIDVVSFKNDHKDLLGDFRTNINKLLKEIPTDVSINLLKEEIETIYNDEFLPSYHKLTDSIDKSKIKWFADNIMKVGFFSVSTTSIPLHFLGLSIPYALLAGAGVSLIASAISYNIEMESKLRENPYNYLLKINETL